MNIEASLGKSSLPTLWILKWISTDPRYTTRLPYYTHSDGGLGIWENEKRAKMAAARKCSRVRFGYWQPVEVNLVEIEKSEETP